MNTAGKSSALARSAEWQLVVRPNPSVYVHHRGNVRACSSNGTATSTSSCSACNSDTASTSGRASGTAHRITRRQIFASIVAVASTWASGSIAGRAFADAALDEELAAQLPSGLPQAPELPRAYTQTVKQLSKALKDAIEAESNGAKEFEVRRKADPAKDLAKQFMRKWQDNPVVAGQAHHDEMRSALQELGLFYQKNGPRIRLSPEAAAAILGHLDAAEAALPPEKKGLLGV